MATEYALARAYFAQAKADLKAAEQLANGPAGVCDSVLCMLFQMFFEKAAKAAAIREGHTTFAGAKNSHESAKAMMAVYVRAGRIYAKDAVAIVERIEAAQPTLAKKKGKHQEQLEYPWEGVKKDARWPERHLSLARDLRDPDTPLAPMILRIAHAFAKQVEESLATAPK